MVAIAYFAGRGGIEIQDELDTAVDVLIGKEKANNLYVHFINGDYDRTISYGLIIVALLIFLYGSYHFLWKPAKEALRRYRSPNRFFFDDVCLVEDMRSLANKILIFVQEREPNVPHANDRLNYASDDMAERVKFHPKSTGGLAIGDEAKPFEVRMMINAQDERLRYEKQTITLFQQQYAGKVCAYLIECRVRKLLVDDSENQLVVQAASGMLGRSLEFYRELVNLLNICAERLNGISK